MKLLVLGGPSFLGRAIADAALPRGHELTFFNRGRTNPELYPEVERIVGDRAGDLGALRGRRWDAVIDNCGYVLHVVRASAEALVDSSRYLFVASISVYARREAGRRRRLLLHDQPGSLRRRSVGLPPARCTSCGPIPLPALCAASHR